MPLSLVDGADKVWIHCAPYGSWKGHPAGPIDFNDKTFGEILKNFRNKKTPPAMDYDHDMLDESKPGPKIASAWIHDMEIRDSGLWALVEFTERARHLIKTGEIRYVSPAVDFKAKSRKTNKPIGAELYNAALTNMPFLDGLTPIRLTRISMDKDIKQVEMSEEVIAAQDEAVDANAVVQELADMAGLEMAAVIAAMQENKDAIVALLTGTAEEEGAAADSEAMATASNDAANAVQMNMISAMTKRIEALEKERSARNRKDIEVLVDEKIAQGYITEDIRNEAIHLFSTDPKTANALFARKAVPIGDIQGQPFDTDKPMEYGELTDVEKETVDCVIAMSHNDISKTDAVKMVLKNRKN